VKEGDKLYLITRQDISPGYQAVQSCHAIRQFSEEHPDVDKLWYEKSNTLALLSVEDEHKLIELIVLAKDKGIRWSAFSEPDLDGAITAIALEPSRETSVLCSRLSLALRE
jgi:peptidyl-tRNA hydrolase